MQNIVTVLDIEIGMQGPVSCSRLLAVWEVKTMKDKNGEESDVE